MAVDVSNRTNQIRHAVYGKEVRENIAGGIEDIAGELNRYEGNLDNEFDDYKKEMNQKQADYENKINSDFAEYREEINQKQLDFEGHMNQRQDTYESEMDQKQIDYENRLNGDFDNYKVEMNQKQDAYESKINGEWSDYKKIMDADELTRKNNEQTRQSNEQSRKNNENTRKDTENIRIQNEIIRQQNEIVRKNNETERIDNEQAREIAFENMEHVDANLELSTARGTYSTLGKRLDSIEGETLVTEELITIPHNFNSYPSVRCIYTNYGAGVGGAGETPAGGTESYLVNVKVCYLDTNSIKIYVPKSYKVKSPVLNKINDTKYILASEDVTEPKSMLINLMEVA
ncbi:hypothetical protein [Clostridium sp.]|uniref:hypothetical protein n=1 Tax=Clostridium sp. TaxID=1506 RepID=UPI00359F16B5